MAFHIGTPPLPNEARGRLYRLAQANRLRRYCEQFGVDPVAVVAGRLQLDTTSICDVEGIIVPEPVDLHAVQYWTLDEHSTVPRRR